MKMNLALFPAFKTNHRDPLHSLSPSLHHSNRPPVGGRLGIHNETAPSATPCYIARTTGNVLAVASYAAHPLALLVKEVELPHVFQVAEVHLVQRFARAVQITLLFELPTTPKCAVKFNRVRK